MIHLQPQERQEVAQYIYSICSIALDHSKDYLIEGRLNPLLESTGSSSFTQFIGRARDDRSGAINRRIIDEITTNETLFFRDSAPFDLMRYKIIPELIDRRRGIGGARIPIRVWSAACSTGQEVYSLAIVLKETMPDANRYDIKIVGTDISDQAVARASAGYFNEIEISRGLGDAVKSRYFAPDPKGWKVRDEIRALTTFKRLNLMNDFSGLGKFDVVFCRNVAIYFNEKDRASLFNRIEQRMERDGYLVIGAMESLTGICPQLESRRHVRSVFYQLAGNGAPR